MGEAAISYNKICGRLCIEMSGYLASPLSVGSGEQEDTDLDVILNARGEPCIPGTSLAGAIREYSETAEGSARTSSLFGTPKDGIPGSREDRQSRIFIYDAVLTETNVGIRDGVKLNERKTASPMGKYELQLVEQGAAVKIRMEILEREDCLKEGKSIEEIWEEDLRWVLLWQNGFSWGEIRLGAKSRRGYGKIKIQSTRIKKFNMQDRDSHLQWLDWDWEQENAFQGEEIIEIIGDTKKGKEGQEHVLEAFLRPVGTLLVRTYATAFSRKDSIPDYGQMTVNGKGKQAVIPGSSWAGAFRSHIAKIVKKLGRLPDWETAQKKLEPLFGTWTDGKDKETNLNASRLVFEETVIEGGQGLPTTRIAVDRFTGGTVQGALYEEIPWTGGKVHLRIRWEKKKTNEEGITDEVVCGLLLWAIRDLQSGFLAVGGETAVGRGIFEADQASSDLLLDEANMTTKSQEAYMKAAAEWVKTAEKRPNGGGREHGELS